MIIRHQNQLYAFFLLGFLALQQSCGTSTALKPAPQGSTEGISTTKETGIPEPEQHHAKRPKVFTDAEQKERLPESILARPEKESASPRLNYDTVLLTRASGTLITAGWQYRLNRQRQVVGFEFSNRGGNRILPRGYDAERNLLFTRDFQFYFDDRARQDIHVSISDWAPSHDGQFKLSELMNSVMYFFPRNYLPAIRRSGERTIVTLPTGEEVEFDGKTHEIRGGVFSEQPVDLNPDKRARKFPGINYLGKGVIVRVNSQGTDPRLGTVATIITGSPASDCAKGNGCDQCQVSSKELWEQSGAVRFKFSTDTEFDRYLLSRCGFGLPKKDNRIVASPLSGLEEQKR
jgi:hypothetical protein